MSDQERLLQINFDELEKRPKDDFFQYYNKNGELLILLLKEYGSGWSSQCSGKEQLRLASDTDIIDLFYTYYSRRYEPAKELTKDDLVPAKNFFQSSSSVFPNFFVFDSIHLLRPYFVLKNKVFQIKEYDGFEKIYYFNPSQWFQS